VIQRAIEGTRRMMKPYDGNDNDDETTTNVVIEVNHVTEMHFEHQIKTLQGAPGESMYYYNYDTMLYYRKIVQLTLPYYPH
jgi:hypothetical protein